MGFWHSTYTEQEIKYVLDTIKSLRRISDDGSVSWTEWGDSQRWTLILTSMTCFETESKNLRKRIVKSVLASSELPANFSEKQFRDRVYTSKNSYEKQGKTKYRVVSPIWNAPPFLNGIIKIYGVSVNFEPSNAQRQNRKINSERIAHRSLRAFSDFFTPEKTQEIEQCSLVSVLVSANNAIDAHERASDALYSILGILNLAIDRTKYWRISSRINGRHPVSEVLIAPQTTVHFENGKLAFDGFWHDLWTGGSKKSARKRI